VTDQVLADVKRQEEIAIAQIETACRQHPGDIAALIIETIQGEGGDNHFRPEFFAELRRLADEYEFLFILDEIQCGMGITGKMWAIEHMGIKPDIIVFGKKAQVCGIIVGPRIDEVADNVFNEASRINSTWGGDLTDMVRAARFLEIMQEEKLLDHTAKMGERLLSGLHSLESSSKGFISNVRGRGMMVAFDVPDKAKRDMMIERMKDNGMYALQSGNHSIRFRGMLDIPAEIIDKALEIVGASLPN
jgi:L-lysine 6-transaminase